MVVRWNKKIKLIWHCLLINRNGAIFYRTRKYIKGYWFLSFVRKYNNELLDTGLDASRKVVHKVGEFMGNKTVDRVTKSNDYSIEKQETVEEIINLSEKRDAILNKLRRVL